MGIKTRMRSPRISAVKKEVVSERSLDDKS